MSFRDQLLPSLDTGATATGPSVMLARPAMGFVIADLVLSASRSLFSPRREQDATARRRLQPVVRRSADKSETYAVCRVARR